MTDTTFSALMTFYMKQYGLNASQLARELEGIGVNVDRTTLRSYKMDETIPPLSRAMNIFRLFGSPIRRDEMQEVLENSQRMRDEGKTESRYFRSGVRLCMSDFDDMPVEQFRSDINLRIKDLESIGVSNFNNYLTYLIRKDMAGTVWPKQGE